jgi:hypothetical protein
VNDAAVVAALMLAHAIFFLQQQQAKTGEALGDLKRDGKADNASADDDDVAARISHDR